jgi:hypothetical protein
VEAYDYMGAYYTDGYCYFPKGDPGPDDDSCFYKGGQLVEFLQKWKCKIDNTPTITISGVDCSAGEILGHATFIDNPAGYEGTITIYINGSYRGAKTYEGTDITWKYSELTGRRIPLATWGQGTFTLRVVARPAYNLNLYYGENAEAEKTIVLPDCGCPEPSSNACPSCDKE